MSSYDESDPTARVSAHEIEVTATPEAVWRAIATGPGIATWFVPAEVEGHVGGRIVTDHGPFGRSPGLVTAWDPPHRFAYEERDWNPEAPDAPPWATEILVEARGGGTCVVRLVSGFFTDGEGWEEQLTGTDEGWAAGLFNLRTYLEHFDGLPATQLMVIGTVGAAQEAALTTLLTAIGLDGDEPGAHVTLDGGAPQASGVLADVAPHHVVVRTHDPAPGTLEIGVFSHVVAPDDPRSTVAVRWYLYGEEGPAVADREQPRWRTWIAAQFEDYAELT